MPQRILLAFLCLFRILGFVMLFQILCFTHVSAQPPQYTHESQELRNWMDSFLLKKTMDKTIPGAVLQISVGDNIIYAKAAGYAKRFDTAGNDLSYKEEMSLDHLFDIASLTKVVGTTTAIMLLHDQGKLNIDDKVGSYIPAFNKKEKSNITIRHLLTHTAGLYEWYPMYYKAKNINEVWKLIGDLPLKYPVGKQRKYSDLGFTILAQIIQVVSKYSFESYLEAYIFSPLDMNNTFYNPSKFRGYKPIAATSFGNPYEKRMVYDSTLGFRVPEIDPTSWNGWRNYTLQGQVNDGNAWYACNGVSGAAGLFSTVGDLQKLVNMFLLKGKIGNSVFISEKTINDFLKQDEFQNGLGWMMDPTNSFMKNAPKGSFGHTGFTGTSIAVVPSLDLSIILLTNRQQKGLNEKGEYENINPIRAAIFEKVLRYAREINSTKSK